MPAVTNKPQVLRQLAFHGVYCETQGDGQEQAIGDCPFCGREGKFYVGVTTGLWQCKVCQAGSAKGGGNIYTFLRALWEMSDKLPADYPALSAERGLIHTSTLKVWGVCKHVMTGDWMIPGYGPDGKINQLYRYLPEQASGKMRFMATPGLTQQLHGVNIYNKNRGDVYICEGPFDGMTLWETLRFARLRNDGLELTGTESTSLLANSNVIAVPGCNIFQPSWAPLLAGKRVMLMYDNDHPRGSNGKTVEGGALIGMRAASIKMAQMEEPPAEINFLKWGEKYYDPTLPSGHDVRDCLKTSGGMSQRVSHLLPVLLGKLEPIPEDWIAGRTKAAAKNGKVDMALTPCSEWKVLVNEWQKALRWTEGLDRALSVMLATIISTKLLGDQLWVKIIGPASCGKSTLCEAISIHKKYVLAKSTIRGFHSGFSDRSGEEDNSLISQLNGKTLVTKDGDTLLQSPNKDLILSEGRDLYDTCSRVHYRNKVNRDYQGIRVTWLLCGTESLRALDSSELGERFLDCVIMERIDDELEDEVNWRAVNRVINNRALEADGTMETQQDPALTLAMQMTGGYIDYLRENASSLLDRVSMGQDEAKRCLDLAKFVAFIRARPNKKQAESASRELSTRLVIQLTRMALCLAAVLNKTKVDEEVMRRVTRIALDTARGRTLEIVKHLHRSKRDGMSLSSLSVFTAQTEDTEKTMLQFLRQIGAVEVFTRPTKTPGLESRPRWRLTEKMSEIYERVHS